MHILKNAVPVQKFSLSVPDFLHTRSLLWTCEPNLKSQAAVWLHLSHGAGGCLNIALGS